MKAGHTEFELKFAGSPGVVAALIGSDFVSAAAPDRGEWERLASRYYDTTDRRLAKKGISLRLREEGGALIQAVKIRRSSAASRLEYETEISGEGAFPAQTGNEDIDDAIDAVAPALELFAETTVDRWASVISFRGTKIELAVDIGRAECRDDEGRDYAAPLAEVELELIKGDPSRVFDFARLLLGHAPLRYRALSKLETAERLARPPGVILPAPRTQIDGDMSAADALQHSLNAIAARLAEVQPFILDFRTPEGVHQMRVALRRLRSIERVFRPYLKSDEFASLAQRAKSFAGALGPARDWDVFIGETLPVAQRTDGMVAGLTTLKAKAEATCAEAWAEAFEAVASKDFNRFILDVAKAGALGAWRKKTKGAAKASVRTFAPAVLDRALNKTLQVAAKTPACADLSARHPLRIALKKLRYPVQLFRPLYPKASRKDYMSALSAMQDAFGAVNDAVAAQSLADRLASGEGKDTVRAAGFIAGYKAAEAQSAVETIDAAWARFEKMTPFWRD
jgi:inorganic triphosphatase YgiF